MEWVTAGRCVMRGAAIGDGSVTGSGKTYFDVGLEAIFH
jgi:acetyltransferase-like isoleucine patch superfamily enzyme